MPGIYPLAPLPTPLPPQSLLFTPLDLCKLKTRYSKTIEYLSIYDEKNDRVHSSMNNYRKPNQRHGFNIFIVDKNIWKDAVAHPSD
jgi:hypothetical protein